jgi:hypothetical protein
MGYNDTMSSGRRFTYKIDKDSETNPGPGKYLNINTNTIQAVTSRFNNGGMANSRFAFGVSRDQTDKL